MANNGFPKYRKADDLPQHTDTVYALVKVDGDTLWLNACNLNGWVIDNIELAHGKVLLWREHDDIREALKHV